MRKSDRIRVKIKAGWVILILTGVVFAAVTFVIWGMEARSPHEGGFGLAGLNAVLNGMSGALLVAGYTFIRKRKIQAHKACMLSAFGVSSLFLVTYLIHHYQVGSIPFQGQGWVRILYFFILIPHVILAALVVPMALATIHRGWTGQYKKHVALARWTLPVWLFVCSSGVVVYLMLY